MTFRWLYGNALAALLDAAAGMAIVALAGICFGHAVPLYYLPLGAALALIPDLDIIPGVLLGRVQGNHRATLFHAPLLVVPAATVAAYALGGAFWAASTAACVMWHYLHDTVEGVTWLRPFSFYYWSFSGKKKDLGAVDHHAWLEETWIKLNFKARLELVLAALLATAAVLITLTGQSH